MTNFEGKVVDSLYFSRGYSLDGVLTWQSNLRSAVDDIVADVVKPYFVHEAKRRIGELMESGPNRATWANRILKQARLCVCSPENSNPSEFTSLESDGRVWMKEISGKASKHLSTLDTVSLVSRDSFNIEPMRSIRV